MAEADWYRDHGITVLTGHRAVRIDRESKVVISNKGTEVPYDHVVLSTGSYAWVPPIPGAEHKNVFVYRTIEDCQQIIEAARRWRGGVTRRSTNSVTTSNHE